MSNHIDPAAALENEQILTRVEALGGGYVWDAEVFVVTLMDVAVAINDALSLTRLVGVQQVALDCSQLDGPTLRKIALVPGLQSLVLCNHGLSAAEIQLLQSLGPIVEVVTQ